MSLSKQLLILLTLIFLIVFSVNFVMSMDNIRSYLQGESEVHVQDTATSLGLSLSPHMADETDPILRTMMNAIFDTGYYKEMRLLDVDDKELIRLTNPDEVRGVPSWLIKFFPIETATAVSEISTGWNIAGTLHVTSNPGYGYLKLYEQFKATLKFSLLILLGAILLLLVVLRMTLRPLKAITEQADDISAGKFTVIEDLPWTKEVRSVAKSMNSMSTKIGKTIYHLNTRLDKLNDNLNRDPLTHLLNQQTFNVDIKQSLSIGEFGHVIYIKFDDLSAVVKNHGKQAVDELLQAFASQLQQLPFANTRCYRWYGSEFAVLTTDSNIDDITLVAEQIQALANDIGQQFEHNDLLHMGIVSYERSSEFERLMPALIEAYEQARLIEANAFYIKENTLSSMTEMSWKATIEQVLKEDSAVITFTNQAYNFSDTAKPTLVMREAFTEVRDGNGNLLPIGTFFSMAEAFDLVETLDKHLVQKVLKLMSAEANPAPVTINLSLASIASADFRQWLGKQVIQSGITPNLLAFSVTAYAAAKDLDTFANFSIFVRQLGAHSLLKRYSSDVIPVNLLKDLHIDYIRLARDLTTEIRSNISKPDLLDIIQEIARLLEVRVLAESVQDEEDFLWLQQAALFGISR
jgi:EAL domain-containing protein (putative c-di-GMP-specific phosphodiesterase class I)/GGDEF domain-containing protein/HAMP domain-containing protein